MSTTNQSFFLSFPTDRIGCVIMASGMGTRFGGNKLMADFCGKPLISHILEITEPLFSCRMTVTRHADIANLCGSVSVPFVLHKLPNRNDTVRLGIQALLKKENFCAAEEIRQIIFCPSDQPLLRPETLHALAESALAEPDYIWRPAFGEQCGSPVIFPASLFDELLHLPAGKGGSAVIKKHPELVRTVPVRDEYELYDVDTKDDLEKCKKLLSSLPSSPSGARY